MLIRNVILLAALWLAAPAAANDQLQIKASDGAAIAVECAGRGPTLLIVHGGTGDHKRWLPMFPLLEQRLRVCAMDRRGHGDSSDGPVYSIAREGQDVAEVAASLPGKVAVLAHSFGAVVSLEAALTSRQISALILYEPPLQDGDHSAISADIAARLDAGQPEAAAEIFYTRIVQLSPRALAQMKSGPNWPRLVASMKTVLRMDRALGAYRWDAARFRQLKTPALLLIGEQTQSPQLQLAINDLHKALPHSQLQVLAGQEHNAMDNDRQVLAGIILRFLHR